MSIPTEIRRDGADWTLYVHGVPCVVRESYQVVANVEDALKNPGAGWPSEADEVAESIRKWAER